MRPKDRIGFVILLVILVVGGVAMICLGLRDLVEHIVQPS